MKGGCSILRNAIAVCETSKTSWETGKNPVWKTIWRFVPVEYHPISPAVGGSTSRAQNDGDRPVPHKLGNSEFFYVVLRHGRSCQQE